MAIHDWQSLFLQFAHSVVMLKLGRYIARFSN